MLNNKLSRLKLLKLLLIFALCINTVSSYAYFTQAKKAFLNTGKALTYLPKKTASKVFSLFKKSNPKKPELKTPIERIMKRPLSIKEKLFYAPIFTVGVMAAGSATLMASAFAVLLVLERIRYKKVCRDIINPQITDYKKLVEAMGNGFLNPTKYVLENIDLCKDINTVIRPTALGENCVYMFDGTPLHIASIIRFHHNGKKVKLIKWLIEEKFANVQALDNHRFTPKGRTHQPFYLIDANIHEIRQYLQIKENQQQDLIDKVDALKKSLDENSQEITNAPEAFEEITHLIRNPEIPGYAKMLVLPKIIQLWQEHKTTCRQHNICTRDDITSLYQYIEFNRSFLSEQQFKPAVTFAQENNILDMKKKSTFEAIAENGTNKKFRKTLSNTLETTPDIYEKNYILKNWLANQPNPAKKISFFNRIFAKTSSFFTGLKNRLFGTLVPITRTPNINEYYMLALDNAKQKKDKKRFRELVNPLIMKSYLRKANLPYVLVGRIMSYAGTDFGNKLLVDQEKQKKLT